MAGADLGPLASSEAFLNGRPRPVLVKLLKINDIKVYYFQSITWKRIPRHAESANRLQNKCPIFNSLSVIGPSASG